MGVLLTLRNGDVGWSIETCMGEVPVTHLGTASVTLPAYSFACGCGGLIGAFGEQTA